MALGLGVAAAILSHLGLLAAGYPRAPAPEPPPVAEIELQIVSPPAAFAAEPSPPALPNEPSPPIAAPAPTPDIAASPPPAAPRASSPDQPTEAPAKPTPFRVHAPPRPIARTASPRPPTEPREEVAQNEPPLPTAAPPTPSPAPHSPGRDAAFESLVREAVQAAVRYPAAARMMGLAGRARLELDYRAGLVTKATLVQSAGAPMLDDAAISAARNAHYPAAPPDVGDRAMRFLVWVEFTSG